MIFSNQNVVLRVSDNKVELPGYRSIFFVRPPYFEFDAGDWMDIEFVGTSLKGGKTYSFSSAPTEDDLRITFRDGLSEIKKALASAKVGDTVTMLQYGNDYDFYLKKNKSNVLIAGGVGIAPFRSMIKGMHDNGDVTDVKLLYLNQGDAFLFKEELESWASKLAGVSVSYINTKELNRKKREKQILSLLGKLNHTFYISGPPNMVESTEHLLIDNGVSVKDIRIDSFGGY